ncbi:MAG: hypothetical protein WCW61_03545 [Patescibacteria group bacterium]|jgi:hypothetical protein
MEKINFKKILLPFFIIAMLFISAFSFASLGHAEDDDEEGERFWFLGREEREEGEWEDNEEEWEEEEWEEEEREEYGDEDKDEDEGEEPSTENIIETPTAVSTDNMVFNLATLVDSDQDGVIDSFDKYSGEDDFAYFLLDKNKNGVGDDLEKLLK